MEAGVAVLRILQRFLDHTEHCEAEHYEGLAFSYQQSPRGVGWECAHTEDAKTVSGSSGFTNAAVLFSASKSRMLPLSVRVALTALCWLAGEPQSRNMVPDGGGHSRQGRSDQVRDEGN